MCVPFENMGKTNTMNKKEMKEYDKQVREKSKKFKLEPIDFHNLYDLFFMVDTPPEIPMDLRETLKLSKMDKWFDDFHKRIEKVVED